MDDKTNNIDRYFKEVIGQYEEVPNETVWKKIAGKLGHHKKRKLLVFLIPVAAGLAIVFALGVAYRLMHKTERQHEQFAISRDHAQDLKKGTISGMQEEKPLGAQKRTGSVVNTYNDHDAFGLDENHGYAQQSVPSASGNIESINTGMKDISLRDPLNELNALEGMPVHTLGGLIQDKPGMAYRPTGVNPDTIPVVADLLATTDMEQQQHMNRKDRWSLGSEFAPLYSYRKVASDYLDKGILADINRSEGSIMAYAGGLRVTYAAGKRLSVQSGIYYSRYGQEKNSVEMVSYTGSFDQVSVPNDMVYLAVVNSTGEINNANSSDRFYDVFYPGGAAAANSPETGKAFINFADLSAADVQNTDLTISQYFDYLELPLLVKYKVIDRKLDFSFMGGFVTNFLVGNKLYLNQDGSSRKIGETTGINHINYVGSIGIGLEYPLLSGLSFTLEPRFRYYLNPIDKSSKVNVHPYSAGIFAGLTFTF
jgi:hypothetical protein